MHWLSRALVLALHDRQIAEHGGTPGIRDEHLLDSALARPRQLSAYEQPPPGVPRLAVSLLVGLARNHAFVDGNKRTATVAMETFLTLNGYTLNASDADLFPVVLAAATGDWDEARLTAWLVAHSVPDFGAVHEPPAGYRPAG